MWRPSIVVRILFSRGRLTERFHTGRLPHRGMVRNSPNDPVKRASGRVVREYIAQTVPRWDPSGEQGRRELADLIRRAEQP